MNFTMKTCLLALAGAFAITAAAACSDDNETTPNATTASSSSVSTGAGGASSSSSSSSGAGGAGGSGGAMGCPEIPEDPAKPHFGYDPADMMKGPGAWGTIASEDGGVAYPACADMDNQQSPIALPSAAMPWAMGGTVLDGTSLAWSNAAAVTSTVNNGHTWLTAFEAMPANTLTYKSEAYSLKQFHFHAPSEHTLDGKQYPMEMHFVHTGGQGAYATVVALFFEEDANDNAELAKVWSKFNACPQEKADPAPAGTTIDLPKLLPANWSHFEYDGSLTAPPCTRTVHFFVVTTPVKASAAQIKAFHDALGNTNRPTQKVIDQNLVTYQSQN